MYEVRFEEESQIYYVSVKGYLGIDIIKNLVQDILNLKIPDTIHCIIDNRNHQEISSFTELEKRIEYANELPLGNKKIVLAIINDKPKSHAHSYLFLESINSEFYKSSLFSTEEAARDWLAEKKA